MYSLTEIKKNRFLNSISRILLLSRLRVLQLHDAIYHVTFGHEIRSTLDHRKGGRVPLTVGWRGAGMGLVSRYFLLRHAFYRRGPLPPPRTHVNAANASLHYDGNSVVASNKIH